MLFDRFIFVLYLVLGYVWFLLGTLYETPYRYMSIISMMASLLAIIVISLCQLQILIQQDKLETNDKWSTITWCCTHLILCGMFCLDGLEWTNIVVIFGLCGLLMTTTILIVASCACFVIMKNGEDWYAHIYLVCVMFWVLVQYMDVRLPSNFSAITTMPVILMACIRLVEHTTILQLVLWTLGLSLHILRDTDILTQETFYWTLSVVIVVMTLRHYKPLFLIITLPFMLLSWTFYVLCLQMRGVPMRESMLFWVEFYNDIMFKDLETVVIPLDVEIDEENWDERL